MYCVGIRLVFQAYVAALEGSLLSLEVVRHHVEAVCLVLRLRCEHIDLRIHGQVGLPPLKLLHLFQVLLIIRIKHAGGDVEILIDRYRIIVLLLHCLHVAQLLLLAQMLLLLTPAALADHFILNGHWRHIVVKTTRAAIERVVISMQSQILIRNLLPGADRVDSMLLFVLHFVSKVHLGPVERRDTFPGAWTLTLAERTVLVLVLIALPCWLLLLLLFDGPGTRSHLFVNIRLM